MSTSISSTRLVLLCILLVCFVHCRHENHSPVFTASFDGTLNSSAGEPLPQSRIDPDFRGYLTRQALPLHPGDSVVYKAENLHLQRGSLLVWLKPGFRFPETPIRLISIHGKPQLDLVLDKKSIEFSLRPNAGMEALYHCEPVHFAPGRWDLFAATWDGATASFYLNGQPQSCSRSEKTLQTAFDSGPITLSIGLNLEKEEDTEFHEVIRDLAIWDSIKPAEWILHYYEQQTHATTLVYRVRDLMHWAGKPVADEEAAGGIAWTGDTQLAELDDLKVPSSGDYDLTFRIKPLSNLRAGSLKMEVWTGGTGNRRLLAARENENNELTPPPPNQLLAASKKDSTYQPLSLRFHAEAGARITYKLLCFLAGKYSFLLDTAIVRAVNAHWQDARSVESLQHTMGVWEEDPQANHGRAWSNQNALNLGPYTCIGQPGRYRATWRIKIGADVPNRAPLVLLKVFAHDGFLPMRRGNKDYAGISLNAADIEKRNQWLNKSVDFNYDGADMMEFYAHTKVLDPGAVCLDTVTIQRLPNPQSADRTHHRDTEARR